MSIQRSVPIQTESSNRWYPLEIEYPLRDSGFRDREFFRDPMVRDPIFRDPIIRDPLRDVVRDHFRDPAWYNNMSVALPLRSMVHPDRHMTMVETEMQRMANEMRKMFSDVQHLMPVDANPESWRIKENFHLDNPIHHDQSGRKVFRLQFDVRQFKPDEIFVKTLDNQLTVHAKHEENHEGKSLLREYHRQYVLPKDLNPENLVSKLNRDGVLSIEAPLPITDGHKDRLIPIKHE